MGSLAAQLAHWGGATAIGTVVRASDLDQVDSAGGRTVALDQPQSAEAIRACAPEGVDRIIEVAFSENADLDAAVAANDGVIAAYATSRDRPEFPFWPMLFANLTIRLFGSDDFPLAAKRQAATDLTAAASEGALRIRVGDPLPLDHIAEAHGRVDAGTRERVLLAIPSRLVGTPRTRATRPLQTKSDHAQRATELRRLLSPGLSERQCVGARTSGRRPLRASGAQLVVSRRSLGASDPLAVACGHVFRMASGFLRRVERDLRHAPCAHPGPRQASGGTRSARAAAPTRGAASNRAGVGDGSAASARRLRGTGGRARSTNP